MGFEGWEKGGSPYADFYLLEFGGVEGLYVGRAVWVKERMMDSQFVREDWRMRMFR